MTLVHLDYKYQYTIIVLDTNYSTVFRQSVTEILEESSSSNLSKPQNPDPEVQEDIDEASVDSHLPEFVVHLPSMISQMFVIVMCQQFVNHLPSMISQT